MEKNTLTNIAILILRTAVGVIFIAHGFQKIFGIFGGNGINAFTESIKSLGLPFPIFLAWAAALSEWLGGIFLLLGIIPRISAALIAIIMIVAIVKVHGANGFFMMQNGFEYQFLILMSCLGLILSGGGKFSLFNKF